MARKRWTPQTELTDSLIRSREKRKWQLSFRRYVLEKTPSEAYAAYFGLDIETLRNWFEIQFTEGLSWDSFGKNWQFGHVLSTNYFDYSKEEDLKLCWNFINLRVEKLDTEGDSTDKLEELAVKAYFKNLYEHTGFSVCRKMLEKIEQIEEGGRLPIAGLGSFIRENKERLENMGSLDPETFNRLNRGNSLEELLLEREILIKFGSGPKP